MIKPPHAWYAAFVRRWHSGEAAPFLGHTGDTVGYHGARMAILAIHIFPDASAALIRACITHDLGEYIAGDMAYPVKVRNPQAAAALACIEEQCLHEMGMHVSLSPEDGRCMKFLDFLDAYLWAQHHAPQLMAQPGWVAYRSRLDEMAITCGVEGVL